MVGLTVVAIGTSLPELIVSMGAALSGQSEIALGNVVGSNIANIGLILGISGIIFPLAVQATLLRREIPLLIGVSILTLLLSLDGQIGRVDGAIMALSMIAFITGTVITARQEQQTTSGSDDQPRDITLTRMVISLVAGLLILLVASRLMVDGATHLARSFGVSELIIGMTLVAVGTSLPELVTSVTAAFQKQSDIAVGNVVGSNIFNLLGILGSTAVVSPIPINHGVLKIDIPVMIGFVVLLLPFLLDRKLSKFEALIFLGLYLSYTLLIVWLR
jgi:cation:H+ antiporter